MAQYTINSRYASVIALDTHARTTTAKGIDLTTGEEKTRRFNDCPHPVEIASWIKENFADPHYAAYESGCTGFYLCRELMKQGIDCDVIAVSSIARSSDDKKRKSDRRDAKRLLKELLVSHTSPSRVWLPDEECEGVRDLLRCYQDAKDALKRSKQQTTALLLRHGFVFNEKTPSGKRRRTWGSAFMRWLDACDLGTEEANGTLVYYRQIVSENAERKARMFLRIEKLAQTERFRCYVDALRLLDGIDTYSAMVYIAEIGDFTRFKNGRSISMWTGTTPKSKASGEDQRANGTITKAGNASVRGALVEGCSSLDRRRYRPVRPKSDAQVSERVIGECNKCNRRLIERYRHLRYEQKKLANVAKIAVANEMIRWVLQIGTLVQEEQRLSTLKA